MARINKVVSSLTAAVLCLLLLGGLPSAFAETFTIAGSMVAVYEFKADGETRKEPSTKASFMKTYKKGALININAVGKNSANEEWYRTAEGTYVKGNQIRLFYKQIESGDQWWLSTREVSVSSQPFDSYSTGKAIAKGTLLHVIAIVENQSYSSLGFATTSFIWCKLENGMFVCKKTSLGIEQLDFRYKSVSCKTGTYEAINNNGKVVELCSEPYTENNKGGTLSVGTRVTVLRAVENKHGNTWYEIAEAQGSKRWIRSVCFKYVGNTNSPQLTATATQMATDGTFTVTIGIKNNTGFASLQITSNYASQGVTLTSVKGTGIAGSATVNGGNGTKAIGLYVNSNITKNGNILILTFRANSKGDKTISFNCEEALNASGKKISVLGTSVTIKAPANRLPGDANGDGKITTGDAMLIARKACGYSVTVIESNCDVNQDGKITTGDAMLVARKACGYSVTLK